MKTILRTALIAALTIAMACQSATAQANPTMSTKYTLQQIEQMYKGHKTARQQNIYKPEQVVGQKFAADFLNAKDIEWEKSDALYQVEFEIGRADYKAYYNMQGELIMYECELPDSELPAVVRNTALAKHPNFKFDDVDKIVKGKDIFYKVDLEKGDLDVKMILKHDGTIINEYFD